MMQGVVTANREAVISLIFLDANGQSHPRNVVIDTGYTGRLTLPPDFVQQLGLPFNRTGRAALADGSVVAFNVYDATVLWDGHSLTIRVDELDSDPLLGMTLMQGYKLTVEDVDGGAVTIERLPNP